MTFNEPVRAGSGVIHIRNAADDSLLLTISVNDPSQVSFSGRDVIINPTNDLPPGNYYVAIAPTAFEDLYDNTIDDTALAAIEALGVVAVASPSATSYGALASAVNGGVVVVATTAATGTGAGAYAVGIYQFASALASAHATAIGGSFDGYGGPEDLIAGNDASLDVSAFSLDAAFYGKVVSVAPDQVDVLGTDGLTYRFFGSDFYIVNGTRLSGGVDISLIEVWAGFGASAHILYSHYVDAPGLFSLLDLDIEYRLQRRQHDHRVGGRRRTVWVCRRRRARRPRGR